MSPYARTLIEPPSDYEQRQMAAAVLAQDIRARWIDTAETLGWSVPALVSAVQAGAALGVRCIVAMTDTVIAFRGADDAPHFYKREST